MSTHLLQSLRQLLDPPALAAGFSLDEFVTGTAVAWLEYRAGRGRSSAVLTITYWPADHLLIAEVWRPVRLARHANTADPEGMADWRRVWSDASDADPQALAATLIAALDDWRAQGDSPPRR